MESNNNGGNGGRGRARGTSGGRGGSPARGHGQAQFGGDLGGVQAGHGGGQPSGGRSWRGGGRGGGGHRTTPYTSGISGRERQQQAQGGTASNSAAWQRFASDESQLGAHEGSARQTVRGTFTWPSEAHTPQQLRQVELFRQVLTGQRSTRSAAANSDEVTVRQPRTIPLMADEAGRQNLSDTTTEAERIQRENRFHVMLREGRVPRNRWNEFGQMLFDTTGLESVDVRICRPTEQMEEVKTGHLSPHLPEPDWGYSRDQSVQKVQPPQQPTYRGQGRGSGRGFGHRSQSRQGRQIPMGTEPSPTDRTTRLDEQNRGLESHRTLVSISLYEQENAIFRQANTQDFEVKETLRVHDTDGKGEEDGLADHGSEESWSGFDD